MMIWKLSSQVGSSGSGGGSRREVVEVVVWLSTPEFERQKERTCKDRPRHPNTVSTSLFLSYEGIDGR